MFYILMFRVLLLAGLIRFLLEFERPFLCAGMYAGARFILMLLLLSGAFLPALLGTAIVFAAASAYFWLLNRFDPASMEWWAILIIGLVAGFFTGVL